MAMDLNHSDHDYLIKYNFPPIALKCDFCDKTFNNKNSLRQHIWRSHRRRKGGVKKCLECTDDYGFSTTDGLIKHLQQHGKSLKIEKKTFETESDFLAWKVQYENSENVRFIKETSRASKTYQYYACNRSGVHSSKATGKRATKSKGSVKCGHYCTAYISVRMKAEDVVATMCLSHYGHDLDLAHIPLSRLDKQLIANKLAQGGSSTQIMHDVRESAGDKFTRIHLLSKNDIRNIGRSFGLQSETNLKTWVASHGPLESSPIILFKDEGDCSDVFEVTDLVMGIMTEEQSKMLQKYGGGLICLDTMRSVRCPDTYLYTVLVINDNQEGYPAAFLFVNRESDVVIKLFLRAIKNKTGNFNCKYFMSDDKPQFYSTWCEVMGGCPKKLLCPWHLDKAWREKLLLISSKTTRAKMYLQLKNLQKISCPSKFESEIMVTAKTLLDIDADFGKYFISVYLNRPEEWACVGREFLNVYSTMRLEALHRVMRHVYLKGVKSSGTFNVTLHPYTLEKYIRHKHVNRWTKILHGAESKLNEAINKAHEKSTLMSTELVEHVDSDKWLVSSNRECYDGYLVEKLSSECDKCPITCMICGVCVHEYTCLCKDYLVCGLLCEHIHLVRRRQSEILLTALKTDNDETRYEYEELEQEKPHEDGTATASHSYDIETYNNIFQNVTDSDECVEIESDADDFYVATDEEYIDEVQFSEDSGINSAIEASSAEAQENVVCHLDSFSPENCKNTMMQDCQDLYALIQQCDVTPAMFVEFVSQMSSLKSMFSVSGTTRNSCNYVGHNKIFLPYVTKKFYNLALGAYFTQNICYLWTMDG